MFGLGLRLAVQSGREALVRLAITALSVAIGVTILLALLANFHAFQITSKAPSWKNTVATNNSKPAANQLVWNYSESIYKGRFIKQLSVAALGSQAPVPRGIDALPAPGQYYASPALAELIKTVPHDQLGDRYPGTEAGTIGRTALGNPDELAIIVGYTPKQLTLMPNTIRVDTISTAPVANGTTNMYRLSYGAGAIAMIIPLLILISTATRLAAARREERYAAMRLVGATPQQINIIAAIDSITSSLLGSLLGIGIFLLLQPTLANLSLSGARFFADYVTPTIWGYLGVLVVVPFAGVITSLFSLRRVRISPLGVSRKVTPRPPKAWRVLPLLIGIPILLYPLLKYKADANIGIVFIGLVIIMAGLITGGSWLTMQLARLMSQLAPGAPSLLAARRIADNPAASFRSVSGLVLAVFVGTIIGVVTPALHLYQSPGPDAGLEKVLRIPLRSGMGGQQDNLTLADTTNIQNKLQAIAGADVVPVYRSPTFETFIEKLTAQSQRQGPPKDGSDNIIDPATVPKDSVIRCADLQRLPVLGTCPARASVAIGDTATLFGSDTPVAINKNLPIITDHSQQVDTGTRALKINGFLVKGDDNTLERMRTYMVAHFATTIPEAPQTFGEIAKARNNNVDNAQRIVLAATALTVLVAACSLAVTIGGSMVERKRPFALLRLSGTPTSALYKVVLLESIVPLTIAAFVAIATGLGVAIPAAKALLPAGASLPYPGALYYVTLGAGFTVSLLIILATLPLLGRITRPDDARFE
ncbi:MAG TPA: FtsX-like permease family protein [Patescibacteria group bacterium]|nr:FtsX-like permease family protein [Patescibacteria group bacterium]